MEYGYYRNGGSEYVVATPHTPVPWHNYLFNKEHHVKVSQLLQGESACLVPFERNYTRGSRLFYIRDCASGECWSPNLAGDHPPASGAGADGGFSCTHGLGYSLLSNRNAWCSAEIRVTVPLEGSLELWQCRVTNTSDEQKELSLFSAFLPETGGMGVKCWYDGEQGILYSHTFPYHVRYEDKERLDACRNYVFMFSDRDPRSWECSERRFRGADGPEPVPAAVRRGSFSNLVCEGENPVGAMEHRFVLEPGEQAEVLVAAGCVRSPEEAVLLKRLWTNREAAAVQLKRVEEYWKERIAGFHIETPDRDLDAYVNYWLKKQVTAMTETHRFSNLSCVRNELQDAIGYSMLDPEGAKHYVLRVMKGQERAGYIRQYRMLDPIQSPSGLALLNHKDGLVWLLLCTCAVVQQTGSPEMLEERAGFIDSRDEMTVYEHLLLAVGYMEKDRGGHGLCLMGDGDWTDPINGAGRLGRGESTWTTMAFLYGLRQFIPLAEARGDAAQQERLLLLADELEHTINRECWDGDWYLAGYDDDGLPFGTAEDEEAQIYLNAQTWAVMSGVARGERLAKCLAAIDRLDTDSGPVVIWPSFSRWDARIGKISIKRQGTTENGSVYCHAALFKAYADFAAGRADKGYETIVKTLPGSSLNPVERNLQPPIWVPNFYFGLTDSPNFGKSSLNHSTGTAAWIIWTVVESLLGVRSTINGLEIAPHAPREWDGYRLERLYKGSRYRIRFERQAGEEDGPAVAIVVNHEPIEGTVLPWEPGRHYQVEVRYRSC
ncbi:MAG: hypothetical protein K0R57_6040 [Paenibacillaceae bacterium]|nr:hypothetical protein [Paenibacillaceae bacterium]